MAIQEFNPVFRPVTNPVNLDKLGQAYDTLEQGHLQTIDTASAVASELAKLDLNEEEDAWRQEQVNKIRSAVTDNTQYGNAYAALDDVISANGSIMSDPGMIGRLRAQQDYKQYIDKLDKRTDLPEDYKNFYKEVNKYNYKDVKDDKGNIIGGTKWQPIEQEVSTVPLDQVLSKALQWAAKESGGGSQTRWLDANGNVTNDITKSVTGEFYSSSTNRWERLSKDKLAAAVTAVLETTPGAKASIEQDYKIAKWKYDKSGGNNPDITDKDGILLTPEQYLNKRIDPFYKAATYYNQTSDTKYGEAWKAQLALARQAGGANVEGGNRGADMLTTSSNPMRIDNFVPAKAQAEISTSKQRLSDMIKGANPNAEFNLDGQTSEDTKKLIMDNITDPVARTQAIRELEIIDDNREYLESLKTGKSKDAVEGFDAYNAIVSMSDLPSNNKYAQQYSKIVNKLYGNNGRAIRQYFTDDDTYNDFITQIGGEEKLKSLGIILGSKDGKKYAELSRDYNRSLYSFGEATLNAVDSSHNFFGAGIQKLKNKLSSNWGDNVMRVNANGEEVPVYTFSGGQDKGGVEMRNDAIGVFQPIRGLVSKLKTKNDEVLDGGKLQISHSVIGQPTPNAAELAFMMKANPEAASKLSTAYKLEINEVEKLIKGVDFVQTGAYIIKDNNMMEEATTEERQELTTRARSSKSGEIEMMAGQDPKTGDWGLNITIQGKYDEDGKEKRPPITFFAPNAVDSRTVASWNNDTTFRAKNDINVRGAAGQNINLTDAQAFANIDKITMRNVGGAYEVINKTKGSTLGTVSNEMAVAYRDAYYQWKDTYNAFTSGIDIPQERIVNMAMKTAQTLANINGVGNNEEIVSYYTDRLVKNLIGQ